MGKVYKIDVVCDLVDIDACYILLKRPWQYDIDEERSGRQTTCKFWWKGVKMALVLSLENKLKTVIEGQSLFAIIKNHVLAIWEGCMMIA